MTNELDSGIFGGAIIAQALWAAIKTVDPALKVHSMHSYFILKVRSMAYLFVVADFLARAILHIKCYIMCIALEMARYKIARTCTV
jgi:hypothetical protein